MINLITSFFRSENTERHNELVTCLKNNIDSKYIKKIYLFMKCKEDIEFLKQEIKITRNKIQLILWNKQPFYSDYLNLANQLIGEICMISNSDIWLKSCDTDLINLIKTNKNIGYSLTRHEHDMSCEQINKFGIIGSFDCFIFISPKLVIGNIKHVQNIPGSEHIFKYFMEKNTKIKFYNPCYDIIIIHEHKSNIRNYNEGDLLYPNSSRWQDNEKAYKNHTDNLYPHPNKDLIRTPPITKKQLLNIINSSRQSGKIFYFTSALFGRH